MPEDQPVTKLTEEQLDRVLGRIDSEVGTLRSRINDIQATQGRGHLRGFLTIGGKSADEVEAEALPLRVERDILKAFKLGLEIGSGRRSGGDLELGRGRLRSVDPLIKQTK